MIKLVAYFTMILDHIGHTFEDSISYENYFYLRILGRIAFPLFAYALTIGFLKTKSVKKYAARLFFWGIISQIPYYLFLNKPPTDNNEQNLFLFSKTFLTEIFTSKLNIMFTLFFSILLLFIFKELVDKRKENLKISFLYALTFIGVFVLVHFLHVDYGLYGLITVLIFYIFRDNKLKMITLFSLLNIVSLLLFYTYEIKIIHTNIQIFSLLSIMFIKGHHHKNDTPLPYKHIFYAFYPLHLLILVLLKTII